MICTCLMRLTYFAISIGKVHSCTCLFYTQQFFERSCIRRVWYIYISDVWVCVCDRLPAMHSFMLQTQFLNNIQSKIHSISANVTSKRPKTFNLPPNVNVPLCLCGHGHRIHYVHSFRMIKNYYWFIGLYENLVCACRSVRYVWISKTGNVVCELNGIA